MEQIESLDQLEHMQIREAHELYEENVERLAELLRMALDAVVEAFKPLADLLGKIFDAIVYAMADDIVPNKWLRLAKRAKKARTRKKYRTRITRVVLTEIHRFLQEE